MTPTKKRTVKEVSQESPKLRKLYQKKKTSLDCVEKNDEKVEEVDEKGKKDELQKRTLNKLRSEKKKLTKQVADLQDWFKTLQVENKKLVRQLRRLQNTNENSEEEVKTLIEEKKNAMKSSKKLKEKIRKMQESSEKVIQEGEIEAELNSVGANSE